jgi:hypothetical protein
MPGARLRSFRLGDRSELLVEHLLAGFAFTTRVPRQEDIGIDFLCSLISDHGGDNLLKAGPFFAVQAKSSGEEIVYRKPHELEWITNQENPFLVCVANRAAAAMDVYSTWNLLCGVLGGGWEGGIKPTCIALRPGETGDTWPGVRNEPDGSQEILLGKPIIRITHNNIIDEGSTKKIAEVLGDWVVLDRLNIVNRHAGLNFVVGPLRYETGEHPGPERGVAFYWNPENLEKCSTNLGRSATGLWRVLHHSQISTRIDVTKPPWPAGVLALKDMLRWCQQLNPELQGFLTDLDVEP